MIRKSGGALLAPKTIARHNLSFTYNQIIYLHRGCFSCGPGAHGSLSKIARRQNIGSVSVRGQPRVGTRCLTSLLTSIFISLITITTGAGTAIKGRNMPNEKFA
jgi:hypothetical protein